MSLPEWSRCCSTRPARDHRQWVVSDTHVFSATVVNSFSFGHQTDLQHAGEDEKGVSPLAGDDVVKAIGLQGVNPSGYHTEGFPAMTISGVTGAVDELGRASTTSATTAASTLLRTP